MLKPEAWVRYGGLTLLDDWTRETQLFIVEKAFFWTNAQVRNANVTYIDPDVTFDLWSHQSPVDWNRTAEDQDNPMIAWTSLWRQQRDRHLHLQRAERERHVKVSGELQLQPCCNTPVCDYQVALNTLISCFRGFDWGWSWNLQDGSSPGAWLETTAFVYFITSILNFLLVIVVKMTVVFIVHFISSFDSFRAL